MKRLISLLIIAVLVALAGLPLIGSAAEFDYHLVARPLARDVYAFIGKTEDFDTDNGGNIVNTAFIVAPKGVIVIDSGPSLRYGRQMRRAIAAITDKPIALVINTHHHPDHFLRPLPMCRSPRWPRRGTVSPPTATPSPKTSTG